MSDNIFTNRIGHQYTEIGKIHGVSGKCDVNSFNQGVLLKNTTTLGNWINEKGKLWYKHMDGTYTNSTWEFINEKWYLFDEEG